MQAPASRPDFRPAGAQPVAPAILAGAVATARLAVAATAARPIVAGLAPRPASVAGISDLARIEAERRTVGRRPAPQAAA